MGRSCILDFPPGRGMPAAVRMPACHSRRFKGERPIGAATGQQSQPPRPCANPPPSASPMSGVHISARERAGATARPPPPLPRRRFPHHRLVAATERTACTSGWGSGRSAAMTTTKAGPRCRCGPARLRGARAPFYNSVPPEGGGVLCTR